VAEEECRCVDAVKLSLRCHRRLDKLSYSISDKIKSHLQILDLDKVSKSFHNMSIKIEISWKILDLAQRILSWMNTIAYFPNV
jgi:hypothetical protein